MFISNCLHEIHCGLERNKDVGMGKYERVSSGTVKSLCLGVARHLLVTFLFHAMTSLHPPSFHRNDFSTCNSILHINKV